MGLLGFVKKLFGSGEKGEKLQRVPVNTPPPYVRYKGSQTHWKKLKREMDDRMDWEREKRSRYGG